MITTHQANAKGETIMVVHRGDGTMIGYHLCTVCQLRPIITMCFRGTGVCSGRCEKRQADAAKVFRGVGRP